ncbi:MAG: PQQ-binding-like beta-propeller repeat protein [Planctomycetota bacterium]
MLVWAASAAVEGADWTQWGGSGGRNMVSGERGLADSFDPGRISSGGEGANSGNPENVRWRVRLGSNAYGNPTVADGRVFVGTDDITLSDDDRFDRTKGGLVKCFDVSNGELLWQLVIPERTQLPEGTHLAMQHLGVCSSPTIEDDRVYVVTSAADIVCLDAHGLTDGNDGPFQDEAQYMVGPGKPPVTLGDRDADILWRFNLIDELGIVPHDVPSNSILIHGPCIYAGTSNGVDKPHEKAINPKAPTLVVLDKMTGRLVATEREGISERLWHAQWSSPSLGQVNGKTLIFFGGADGILYAFEAIENPAAEPQTLKKVWWYDCNPPHYRYRDGKPIRYMDGDKRPKGSPNKNDGTYLGPSEIIATPVFVGGRIYVPIGQDPAHGRGHGLMHCVDPSQTGDITQSGRIWTFDKIERSLSTVAVCDGVVYAADVAGTLYTLDAETGQCHWKFEANMETWGGPLVADGKLYWGTKKHFYVFTAGREPQLLSQLNLGSPVYTTPVAANGVLFIASQRYLWAVEKGAGTLDRDQTAEDADGS